MRDILKINDQGQLVLLRWDDTIVPVHSMDDLPDTFYCSSSIDFPEEYTSDPAVIAFCRSL